jgi:hypothetical protein
LLQFGGGLNLAQWLVPNEQNKLKGVDLNDPQKYRGWQASLWGDYRKLQPTTTLAEAGRLPEQRFRGGALFGADGAFVLGEIGGHYGGADAAKLTAMFVSGGLAYAPRKPQNSGFNLKKIGFKATQIDLQKADSLAPRNAAGEPQNTSATRITPFASLEFEPAAGQTVSLGGSAGITAASGKDVDLSDFRGDVAYTYLGSTGTEDLPVFRVQFSVSGSRPDFFNPASPRLYGVSGKVQADRFFGGFQFNWGADQLPAERAAQMYDVRTEAPSMIRPGGDSALIVFGVLLDRGKKEPPPAGAQR